MRAAALLVLSAVLAGFGPSSPSQDRGIKVEDAGFGFLPSAEILNFPWTGRAATPPKFIGKFDMWAPFQAVLVNDGPARAGVLILRPYNTGAGEAITYSRRISLPRDGRKRVTFPVRSTYEPMGLSFRDDNAGAVRLDDEWIYSVREPRIASPRTEIVLIASDARINYGHLVAPTKRRSDQAPSRLVVVVSPEQLPQTALEYDVAGLLILDDIAADALTPAQASAIHQWVCRGGTVVLSLLRNTHRIKGTHIEPLLAGAPAEVRNVKEMKAFEQATTQPCRFDVETAVQTFKLPEGSNGDPTLVHRRIERGLAIACGLPLSSRVLESWARAPHLLDAFLKLGRQARIPLPGGAQAQRVRDSIAPALKGSILKSVPPFKAVALLMAIYIAVLVVLPYAVMRPFKRLELAWIGIVFLALAGSGVVYGVGVRYLRAESVACRVTLVEGGGTPGPHLRHNFWCLFSASGGSVDLGFEDPPVVPFPFGRSLGLRGAGSPSEPLQVAYDADSQVRSFPTYAQDSVLFETTDTVSLPGRIGFQIRKEADGSLRGRVDVDDKFLLRDAWVVDGGRIVRVRPGPFEIPPGNQPVEIYSGTLLDRRGFEGVTQALQAADPDNRHPVLLYRYEGAPSLKNAAIHEEAIHFGIVEPSEWREATMYDANWYGTVYLPAEASIADREELEFILRTRDVPPDFEAHSITVSTGFPSFVTVELYNRVEEVWIPSYVISTPGPFITRSSFGGLAVKARLVAFRPGFSRRDVLHEIQITAISRIKAARK